VWWNAYQEAVTSCRCTCAEGRIDKVIGLVAEGSGPRMGIGALCAIENADGRRIPSEVIGFRDDRMVFMSYGEMRGIQLGCRVIPLQDRPEAAVGEGFLGRVVDGLGRPMDGLGPLGPTRRYPLYAEVVNPMDRRPIREPVGVGVSVMDALITVGRGQRMAIMAGSGVGKSVLMGMIARNTAADVCVVALIGERGREVKEFLEKSLGQEGLAKSVVVAATSDVSPLIRMRGAYLATALAEYFRDRGQHVVLMMDSVTRFAMSCRDVGLAAGEPPTVKGYTPSFFVQLPKLLERAGNIEGKGSVTGIYTVLVDGDDMNDPVGDAVRSVADGHVVLSRKLAHQGHYPAVDVLASVSRVMGDIVTDEHLRLAKKVREILSHYREMEDLINIGAYVEGSDPKTDYARKMIDKVRAFLRQDTGEKIPLELAVSRLQAVFKGATA